MTDRLDELLELWEEAADAGRQVSAVDLCKDCPQLADELQRRIDRLQGLDWLKPLQKTPKMSNGIALAAGEQPVPGYRLTELLGRGGYGEVWKADGPNGPIALKVVRWADRAAASEWRSLDAAKGIRHPHVLTTLDAWDTEAALVVAMELADRSLWDRFHDCRSQGLAGIPAPELRRRMTEAACGIDHLNGRGIQHRDIKPSNLLLVGDTVKVGDFGLARLMTHSQTGHTGALTLAYAAPEFFEGRTSRTSDQYGLAVTYCQLRCGRLPFEGTPAQVVAGHLKHPPDLSMLPPDEQPAVAKALNKRPDQRWPTCSAFVEAIGKPDGSRRWSRRGILAAAVIPAVALAAYVIRRPKVSGQGFLLLHLEQPSELDTVRSVAVGPMGPPDRSDNPRVVFATGTGGSYLWDVQSGKLVRRFPFVSGAAAALAPFWVPRGAAADNDGNVFQFDLNTGKTLTTSQANDKDVNGLCYSPDGRLLWAAGSDRVVRAWDVQTGAAAKTLQGHEGIVTAVAADPTNLVVVTGGWDGQVIVWDAPAGKPRLRLTGHAGVVQDVALSPDWRRVASGGWDGAIRLWDIESGHPGPVLTGHDDQVRAVLWLDRRRLASCSHDRTVRVWDTETGRQEFCSPPFSTHVECLSVVGGGPLRLAVGTGGVGVWVCQVRADWLG